MASSESIWESLAQSFDERLPRRTAVALKPSDSTILYAYPAAIGTAGWYFDDRTTTGYDENPAFELFLGPWFSPGLGNLPITRMSFVWESQEYRPDLVCRKLAYSDNGLHLRESFGRAVEGAFTWQLDVQNYSLEEPQKSLYIILKADRGFEGLRVSENGALFTGAGFSLAFPAASWGVYDYLEQAEEDIRCGGLSGAMRGNRYLVMELRLRLKAKESAVSSLGISFDNERAARDASQVSDLIAPIRERWDNWFQGLARPEFANEREKCAYYKCWWVVKTNYYENPRFGHMVCEALPVYRGYWLWGLDASEWHSDQNTVFTSVHIRRALDLFMDYQREDGFITHAIYLSEKTPGENWSRRNITQTPHIPWVALRHAEATGDPGLLKEWYPRLRGFYQYLCASRDAAFRDLHLWGIITSYDTGLDTTSAFQKVTYGVDGVKESFCYPAIFAAERCRYEQALARMAQTLETGEANHWRVEAEKTREAMDRALWDAEKGWYGVLHEDGTLDTRVGVDGLFPLAYGLVDEQKAAAAKANYRRLIGKYGIHTVAPGEPGYEADFYWRGPAWPKSCAMGIVAARNYYPDLVESAIESMVNMLLRWPSVWECLNPETGQVARGDQGACATPVISSNVGSGEALGVLLTARGVDMMAFDGALCLAPVQNFHWGGFRLDLCRDANGWELSVRAEERQSGALRLRSANGQIITLEVEAGKSYSIRA